MGVPWWIMGGGPLAYGLKVVSLYAKGNLEWHPYVTLSVPELKEN